MPLVTKRVLNPEEIITEFQRRRRRTSKVIFWTLAIGIGGVAAGVSILHSLPHLPNPPYWLFAGIGIAMMILVFGALIAPHLYRCPRCERIVQVPDWADSGNILVRNPAKCPHCGVRLRTGQDDGIKSISFRVTFRH